MQETHRQKIRNVWHSRFQLISRGGDSVESHARFGHRLHFRAKRRTRSRSGCCFGAGDLRRQYFSHRAAALGLRQFWLHRHSLSALSGAGRRVFGFLSGVKCTRSPAFGVAVNFHWYTMGRHFARASPTNILNESGTVFLAFLPSSSTRRQTAKSQRFSHWSYIRHDGAIRYYLLAWCASSQGDVAPEAFHGSSAGRRADYLSWFVSPFRNDRVDPAG